MKLIKAWITALENCLSEPDPWPEYSRLDHMDGLK